MKWQAEEDEEEQTSRHINHIHGYRRDGALVVFRKIAKTFLVNMQPTKYPRANKPESDRFEYPEFEDDDDVLTLWTTTKAYGIKATMIVLMELLDGSHHGTTMTIVQKGCVVGGDDWVEFSKS